MASRSFLLQLESAIPIELIQKAVSEIPDRAQTTDTKAAGLVNDPTIRATGVGVNDTVSVKHETYRDLLWTVSCAQIKDTYVSQHYKQISINSPEFKIVDPSKIEKTGGKVFELLGGQKFVFPAGSVYAVILLDVTGSVTIEVKAQTERPTPIPWQVGSILYLTGDCALGCVGDGTVLCIILAMSYGKE